MKTYYLTLDLKDATAGEAKLYTLHAGDYMATNSMTDPEFIKPIESTVSVGASRTVPAYTIEVLDIPLK